MLLAGMVIESSDRPTMAVGRSSSGEFRAMPMEAIYPMVSFTRDGMCPDTLKSGSIDMSEYWVSGTPKQVAGLEVLVVDCRGRSFILSDPEPERRLSGVGRFFKQLFRSPITFRFRSLREGPHVSLEDLRRKMLEAMKADREFWEESAALEQWEEERLTPAKTYEELIRALDVSSGEPPVSPWTIVTGRGGPE